MDTRLWNGVCQECDTNTDCFPDHGTESPPALPPELSLSLPLLLLLLLLVVLVLLLLLLLWLLLLLLLL